MLAVTALLERWQFQLRATESSRWWASNGRDVVNAIALGAMSVGLWMLGLTGPIAVGIAATVVVLLSAVQATFDRHRLSGVLSLLTALALGLPVLLFPDGTHALFRGLIRVLIP